MSSRTAEALMWAQRIVRKKGSPPHELLEIPANATAEQIQEAFHKIARTAHPDLHRHGMNADELELLTSAYATVAGAYQAMRTQTQRMRVVKPDELAKVNAPPVGPQRAAPPPPIADPEPAAPPPGSPLARMAQAGPPRQHARAGTSPPQARTAPIPTQPRTAPIPTQPRTAPIPTQPRTAPIPVTPAAPTGSGQHISPKALVYYRKAELCLRRGDLKGAVLQLKLACAADPTSSFLRGALAEVQAELAKT